MLHRNKVILPPLGFTILVTMIVIYFLKKILGKKNDKVKFEVIPKLNKKFISVTYLCLKFIDSYRFLSDSLGKTFKNLNRNDFIFWKKIST